MCVLPPLREGWLPSLLAAAAGADACPLRWCLRARHGRRELVLAQPAAAAAPAELTVCVCDVCVLPPLREGWLPSLLAAAGGAPMLVRAHAPACQAPLRLPTMPTWLVVCAYCVCVFAHCVCVCVCPLCVCVSSHKLCHVCVRARAHAPPTCAKRRCRTARETRLLMPPAHHNPAACLLAVLLPPALPHTPHMPTKHIPSGEPTQRRRAKARGDVVRAWVRLPRGWM